VPSVRFLPQCVIALGLFLSSVSSATTVERIGNEFVHASKQVFTWKTALIFGSGIAATALSTTADQPLFDNLTHKGSGLWVDAGNFLGTPVPAIGLFAVSVIFPVSPKFQQFGETLAAAMITSTLITTGLKYAIGRTRPSGTNNLSLPSGHTTVAFTTAAVLQQYYGWSIGVPAYALATLCAAARVADGAHWFSDTVLGATIGIGVAELFRHSVASDENSIQVVPYTAEQPLTKAQEVGVRITVPWSI